MILKEAARLIQAASFFLPKKIALRPKLSLITNKLVFSASLPSL